MGSCIRSELNSIVSRWLLSPLNTLENPCNQDLFLVVSVCTESVLVIRCRAVIAGSPSRLDMRSPTTYVTGFAKTCHLCTQRQRTFSSPIDSSINKLTICHNTTATS